MQIREATEADLPGILVIYNHAVLTTTAVWNESVVDLENRRHWLGERKQQGYPVLIAALGSQVLGYASFGDFRAWHGYRYTVEHSLYVHREHRRCGIGGALLAALLERAQALEKHIMVGGIEGGNEASLRLHEQFGFRMAGRLEQVGTKFGKWLDLVFMQRTLGAARAAPAA
jgi:phosphinothricin acetyltransferase